MRGAAPRCACPCFLGETGTHHRQRRQVDRPGQARQGSSSRHPSSCQETRCNLQDGRSGLCARIFLQRPVRRRRDNEVNRLRLQPGCSCITEDDVMFCFDLPNKTLNVSRRGSTLGKFRDRRLEIGGPYRTQFRSQYGVQCRAHDTKSRILILVPTLPEASASLRYIVPASLTLWRRLSPTNQRYMNSLLKSQRYCGGVTFRTLAHSLKPTLSHSSPIHVVS